MPPADDPTRKGHTLTDHVYGIDLAHTHDGYADHDHDFPDDEGALEDNPIWIQDHVSLTSVGIDIGSSGTQVIFSRIHLRRLGEDLSSRYFVVSREIRRRAHALSQRGAHRRGQARRHHRRRL
jgi:ethanolamine utilization protein EutA